MSNFEWFKKAEWGLMVHFGLYSLLGGVYRGQRSQEYAEWIQSALSIPIKETEKLASVFNPIYFDADEWIGFAKECGMKYFVITAKHHEGFALFKSEADSFNSVDSTPFGRDIIKELSEACARHGIKFGIYYSQDLDWHEKHGGGYKSNHIWCSGVSWDNSWDFPCADEKNFDITYSNKILPQVKELMQNYGEISLVWFDVPMTLSEAQSRELYDTVKHYQPNCLINSRLGNGMYDYVSFGDNEIPDSIPEFIDENVDYNDIMGFKPSPNGLYESACTLNNSWGYASFDHDFKSPEAILKNKRKLNSLGMNYLINIGPDHLGRFPMEAMEILRKVAELEKVQ